MKKMIALILAALMLCTVFAGCESAQSATADYQVRVVDAKGNPYTSGIIVRFIGEQDESMQVIDENGTVTKELARGDYTVELKFTDENAQFVYDQTDLKLTADKTELEISLAYGLTGNQTKLYHKANEYDAHFVDVCCTQVNLIPNGRSYYLFAPKQSGTYEFSVIGDIASFGCYGTPFYIQEFPLVEVKDNSFTVSVSPDMVGSGESGANVYVLGIDAKEAQSCVLSIERIGEHEPTINDTPLDVYKPSVELKQYTLPEGATLLDFDLTADAYNLVFNENDGFYHLNSADGPLVLAKLGVDNKYIPCYKTMMTKTGVQKYFFDENGKCIRREDYYDCLAQYIGRTDPNNNVQYEGVMDQVNGVYPLTKDLKYIIQSHGEHSGWWKLDSNTSIFRDDDGNPIPGINAEIAWLVMCVYIAQ